MKLTLYHGGKLRCAECDGKPTVRIQFGNGYRTIGICVKCATELYARLNDLSPFAKCSLSAGRGILSANGGNLHEPHLVANNNPCRR